MSFDLDKDQFMDLLKFKTNKTVPEIEGSHVTPTNSSKKRSTEEDHDDIHDLNPTNINNNE